MIERGNFRITPGMLLFLALVLLWIPWLGETPFYSKGEPREAIVAMSMLDNGDWILPSSCDGEIPFKPPFLAWLIAIFAWLLNGGAVNEFVARLPSALAAIAMIIMGFRWARRTHDDAFALVVAMVTATSFEVFRAAEACRVDMVLTAAMVGAMYVIFEIRERKGRDNVALYCAAAALLTAATLTKGPVGALLPCLAGGLYLLFRGDNFWKSLYKMVALCLVSFALPALWYYAAWKRGGDMFVNLALEENIGRLTGSMSYDSHEQPFWYNFLTILAGMLPWTVLAALALFRTSTWRHWPLKPAGLLSVVTALTVIIFYCVPSSKRSVYLLPAYPFMAYGVAVIVESLRGSTETRIFGRGMMWLGIVVPVAVALVELVPNNFFPFFHIHGFLGWTMLAVPVAAALWWWKSPARTEVAIPVVWALLLCYNASILPAVFHNPLKTPETAAKFEALKASDAPIYIIGIPNTEGKGVYWPNFFLGDRMKRVPTVAEAEKLPAGTKLWLPLASDTTALSKSWTLEEFGFNPDNRRTAWIATKR